MLMLTASARLQNLMLRKNDNESITMSMTIDQLQKLEYFKGLKYLEITKF
jgi:uncharacterized phage-associated protein